MTTDKLTAIEAAARRATPGPWWVYSNHFVGRGEGHGLNAWNPLRDDNGKEDATHIANCSPERILALCRVVRAAREIRAGVVADIPAGWADELDAALRAWEEMP